MKPIAIDEVHRQPARRSMSDEGAGFIRPRNLGRRASENPLRTRSPGQPISAQPLNQRHFDLRLLAQRGGEADLPDVLSSYRR